MDDSNDVRDSALLIVIPEGGKIHNPIELTLIAGAISVRALSVRAL